VICAISFSHRIAAIAIISNRYAAYGWTGLRPGFGIMCRDVPKDNRASIGILRTTSNIPALDALGQTAPLQPTMPNDNQILFVS
jgi:hypothetical protein